MTKLLRGPGPQPPTGARGAAAPIFEPNGIYLGSLSPAAGVGDIGTCCKSHRKEILQSTLTKQKKKNVCIIIHHAQPTRIINETLLINLLFN